MGLLEMVKNSLSDETEAKDEYGEMMQLTSSDSSLSDEEKSLITGILFKIQTDEKTHKVLLNIIHEVLESKQ